MNDKRIIAKKQIVLEALDSLFGDTSVEQKVTLEAMEEIEDEVRWKIEALKADIKHKDQSS